MTPTYYKRKAEGLCVECGRPLPYMSKHVRCDTCLRPKEAHPRPNAVEKAITIVNTSLDDMAKEAHRRGISYGTLQSEETIDRIRYAEKAHMTLKRWGRQVTFI